MAAKRYAVELHANVNGAQFLNPADGKNVELDKDNPRFETSDLNVYRYALDLPFLKDASSEGKKD